MASRRRSWPTLKEEIPSCTKIGLAFSSANIFRSSVVLASLLPMAAAAQGNEGVLGWRLRCRLKKKKKMLQSGRGPKEKWCVAGKELAMGKKNKNNGYECAAVQRLGGGGAGNGGVLSAAAQGVWGGTAAA
jgi:hypothetical protein